MMRGRLVRTIMTVLACAVVLLPMASSGVAAASTFGQVTDGAGGQFGAAAEAFMSDAMYLLFEPAPAAALSGEGDTDATYASLTTSPVAVSDLMLAQANVSAMNDLCLQMNAFFLEFGNYAEHVPAAAALFAQAQELKIKLDEVAMMRQDMLAGLAAQNETEGMFASAAPVVSVVQDGAPAAAAEGECQDMLANFKKSFGAAQTNGII